MSRLGACLLACLALLTLSACGSRAERGELRDDLSRFRAKGAVEYEQLKRDLNRYAIDQGLRTKELPLDVAAFLEWRHREWWNLTDEMAALMTYEWHTVEMLVYDAARFYGYEVRNFPLLGEDAARFFERADEEWDGLVRDVCIFVEFQEREMLPLRADIRQAYDRLKWETGNLQVDLNGFIGWREREWRKLVHASDEFMVYERGQGKRMREDLRRFRAARALEANYLVADFKTWWHYEVHAMPPRLIQDTYRWAMLPPRELALLRDDIAQFGENIGDDTLKLVDDLSRYADAQLDVLPKLVADVDHFFSFYEREYRPLTYDVRRWWRYNVGLGLALRKDMRDFFLDNTRTEMAELQESMYRFVHYSGKEWKDFRAALARFFSDDSGRAFGDRSVPMPGDAGRMVFDDVRAYPVRGYDAGDE